MTIALSSAVRKVVTNCHPVLRRVFREFGRQGVRWALLRVPEGGLADPQSDVDLLVHPRDLSAAASLLNQASFARVPRRSVSHHYLCYCADADRWLWLHVTTSVGFGSHRVALDDTSGCLARRHIRDGVAFLEPAAAFWLLLWHCLILKGTVAAHHRAALADLCGAAAADDHFAAMFAAGCGGHAELPARLLQLALKGEWAAVEGCAPAVHKIARVRECRQRMLRLARGAAGDLSAPGLRVAVLGPDGAGKSTLIAGIRAAIPLPSRAIYMGLTGGATRFVRRFPIPGVAFLATAAIIWSRYLRGWYHSARGRLVVFDRYIYDAVAPPASPLTRLQRLSRRLSGHLCPQPDLTVFLDAPGGVMHARKGAYTPQILEQWRTCFRTLSARISAFHLVDATRSCDEVRIDVVHEIWRRQQRLWTRAGVAGGCP